MAEALQSVGYATGLFGKWHLGGEEWEGRRGPNEIKDSTSGTASRARVTRPSFTSFEHFDADTAKTPHIWEGRTGESPRKVTPTYGHSADGKTGKQPKGASHSWSVTSVRIAPSFLLSHDPIHFPTLPASRLRRQAQARETSATRWPMWTTTWVWCSWPSSALGFEDNTIVFWCTDNGAEERRPWRGTAGPWRGFYNTMLEGGIRTPCVIRWPGRIPAGQVSNEIVHAVDFFPTLAAAVGAPEIVPGGSGHRRCEPDLAESNLNRSIVIRIALYVPFHTYRMNRGVAAQGDGLRCLLTLGRGDEEEMDQRKPCRKKTGNSAGHGCLSSKDPFTDPDHSERPDARRLYSLNENDSYLLFRYKC